jgi:hypothetical protein
MKKIIVLLYITVAGLSAYALPPKDVNEKLLHSFKVSFPNAEQVKWTEHKDGYVVNFVDNSIQIRILYGENAEFIASIRYYSFQSLPLNLLVKLTNKYPGKSFFGVTEITSDAGVTYQVVMQDQENWYQVKVAENGDIHISDKFKKASKN